MHYLFFLIYIFMASLYSHDYSLNGIQIYHPTLKVVNENSKVGAGYMRIINNTGKNIKLMGIESKIAFSQEIHEVILQDGVYKMRPIKKGLIIEANKEIEFKPKSYHFMFFNIKNTPEKDALLSANLIFSNNIILPIKFKVLIGQNNKEHNH